VSVFVLIDVVSFEVKAVFIVEEDIAVVVVAKKNINSKLTSKKLKNQNVLLLSKNFMLYFSTLF